MISIRHVAVILGLAACAAAAEPAFQPDGTVLCGALRLAMNANGEINLTGPGGTAGFHLPIVRRSDSRWSHAAHLDGRSTSVDPAARSVTLRGDYRAAAGEPATAVAWGYTLLPDGTVRIAARTTGRPLAEVATAAIAFHSPRSLHVGKALSADGRELSVAALEAPQDGMVQLFDGPAQQVSAVLGLPARLVFAPAQASAVRIIDRRSTTRGGGGTIEINTSFTGAEAWVDLRLEDLSPPSAGSEIRAGVDYGIGGLRMPQHLAGNLIENPGFEQGFRYWDKSSLGAVMQTEVHDFYRIAEEGAYEGRRCLELLTESGVRPASLSAFSAPVEAGKPYVFSFWARADREGCQLDVDSHTAEWPKFDCGRTVKLTTAWARYQVPFTASNRVIAIGFAPAGKNPTGAVLRVDAVQLEAGTEAKPFICKPVAATLVSNGRGNLLPPGAPVGAALRLDGRPGLRGTIEFEATALDGSVIHRETLPVDLGEAGTQRIALPWAETLGRGMFAIETRVACEGFADRDHHRLTIMPALTNTHHHRLLCAGGAMDSRYGNWPRWAEFFQRSGVGSMVVFDPAPDGFRTAFADRGVYFYSSIFDGGENVVLDGEKIELRKRYPELTAAQLAGIEELCYRKARANPQIRHWKTFNEIDAGGSGIPLLAGADKAERMKAFVALHRAAWNGIKRADPGMQVMTPDCSSMYPSTGIAFIDAYFAAGGDQISDICAIHTYRSRPEDPDLSADIGRLIAVLDRYRFRGDIWFTEGIYHQPWHVPAFGLDPYQACSSDHFRAASLSYHLAWAERISAAFTMRSWLVGFKHADRVRNMVDWGFPRSQRTLDHDFTPTALVFASNTLVDLLGDATWRRDVEFGAGVRGYVFEDNRRRPVVALWSYDADRDRGQGTAPELVLPALPAGTERIAFDGAAGAAADRIAITPFPVFLRGPAGSLDALCAALDAGTFPAGGVTQLHAGLRLAAPDRAEAQVRNLLGRPLRGRLQVSSAGRSIADHAVEIPARGTATEVVPVAMAAGTLTPVEATIAFTPEGVAPSPAQTSGFECGAISHVAAPPAIDGDLSDWPADTAIAVPERLMEYGPLTAAEKEKFKELVPWKGPGDLSASLRMAWDEQHLYLGIEVRDDVHDPIDDLSRAWMGDSLQLYVDAWGDARERGQRGYGNDDQAFRLWTGADDRIRILRDAAPERQVAFLSTGPVTTVQSAFRRVGDRSVYELALPLRELQPVVLKPGSVFGFAVLVNDRDGDWRKRALTMTAPGTEPHMHPERLPLWVLR